MQATMQSIERRSVNAGQPGIQPIVQPAARDALDLLEQFGATVSMQREHEIHGQGEQAKFCYRILSGCVRLVRLMEDGRRQIGEFLMAGDLLGFDALETHDFAAEAVSDVVLRRYPRRRVDALAGNNIGLARRLRDMTATSLRMTQMRLMLLGRKTASERIATFLIEMDDRLPQVRAHVLDMPMSRTDMADHLGLTIETVCRILAHLRRDGTIAIERGRIEIHDSLGLERMASEPRH
jgi:CRP/FNR family transcriptional regulator, nitrogen fixation regulation protein